MAVRALALLTGLLLLSGCSGSDAPPSSLAPASSSSQVASAAATPEAPVAPLLANVTASCDGERTAVGSGQGYGVNYDASDFCHLDAMFDLSPTLYAAGLVEIAWASLQATTTEVRASIQSADCTDSPIPGQSCSLGNAVGTASPLRIELDAATLLEHGDKDLAVSVSITGAAAQQPFTVHVSLFNTPRIPSDYTALP